jgi:multidrug resistance efflux pump
MPSPFSETLQSIDSDSHAWTVRSCLIGLALLVLWMAWFFLVPIRITETTRGVRIELSEPGYRVEVPLDGVVVSSTLALGGEVQAGDVLVTLDSTAISLQIVEIEGRLASQRAQLAAIRREETSIIEAQEKANLASGSELKTLRGQYAMAQAASSFARTDSSSEEMLLREGHISSRSALQSQSVAQAAEARTQSQEHNIARARKQREADQAEFRGRLERLQRDSLSLTGEIVGGEALLERLEHERERHLIRAPVAGRIGGWTPFQTGAVLHKGQQLATLIPPRRLEVLAEFAPERAVGRVKAGQPAELRLDAYPWPRYGIIAARVSVVAGELSDGRVQVRLELDPNTTFAPLERGLTGTLSVEIDRATPAQLVLSLLGQNLQSLGSTEER